jgi:hypothetical protein
LWVMGWVKAFLHRKWARELDYRLINELRAFTERRIAVRFAYEWARRLGPVVPQLRQRELRVQRAQPHAAALRLHQRPIDQGRGAAIPLAAGPAVG